MERVVTNDTAIHSHLEYEILVVKHEKNTLPKTTSLGLLMTYLEKPWVALVLNPRMPRGMPLNDAGNNDIDLKTGPLYNFLCLLCSAP